MKTAMTPLLSVSNLQTHFKTPHGIVQAVNDVSFQLKKGEILGIVGESGSGKSVLAQSLMRVVPETNLCKASGEINFNGIDLMNLTPNQMREIRGASISMVTQNPSTSLNPVFTVEEQLLETLKFHPQDQIKNPRKRMLQLMTEVQLPNPELVAKRYPFQLSGGMKQRIAIAMALMCEPKLLIADEPTTALDVTIQAQLLELIKSIRNTHGTSIIVITHDLGVVAQLCDTVGVIYAGQLVEYNTVEEIFQNPRHPYTKALLDSNPVFGNKQSSLKAMKGQPPQLTKLGAGCSFADRCEQALPLCHHTPTDLIRLGEFYYHRCSVPTLDGVANL